MINTSERKLRQQWAQLKRQKLYRDCFLEI